MICMSAISFDWNASASEQNPLLYFSSCFGFQTRPKTGLYFNLIFICDRENIDGESK